MEVFKRRNNVIESPGANARSFLTINGERIDGLVQEEMDGGSRWSDPLVQLSRFSSWGRHYTRLDSLARFCHASLAAILLMPTED